MTDMKDLYSDYLIASFGLTTATWLAKILEWQMTHDKITKFLNWESLDSKQLRQKVKPTVREIDDIDNVLIFDDTVEWKPYSDLSDINCWHYDHTTSCNIKGVNMMSCLLSSEKHNINIPIGFEIIAKPELYCDIKTKKVKRKSKITKNEILINLFNKAVQNNILFEYVLYDSWFASNDTLKHIVSKWKHVITEIKTNRVIALNDIDRNASKFKSIIDQKLDAGIVYVVYLKQYDAKVALVKQVFINKDGSTWVRYLLSTDISLSFDKITSLYKRRWKIEESFKSMKSNTWFSKSPTKTIKSQSNHYFMSIYAYFKLQLLSSKLQLNNFCLKAKLYFHAIKATFSELQLMKEKCDFKILA